MAETTDRELLIRFEGKMDVFQNRLEHLTDSINNFTNTVHDIEEKKIGTMEKRLAEVESWKARIMGAWVVILFLGGLITAGIIGLVKYFMK
jgi:hypothetical protein